MHHVMLISLKHYLREYQVLFFCSCKKEKKKRKKHSELSKGAELSSPLKNFSLPKEECSLA